MTNSSAPERHDLEDFILAATEEMAREYERIQKRALEDPGTAGDQGEENWGTLLRSWLPHTYHVVTKGRILSDKGTASPQVDVLVLHPSYPPQLLDRKLYLAGGVAAAFECKVTLRSEHIPRAVENAALIRRLLTPRVGNPYRELNSPIIYGLLAHSHSWKRERSKPVESIETALLTAQRELTRHPREILDFLCVADLATWVAMKTTWLGPGNMPGWNDTQAAMYGPQGSANTVHSCFSPEHEQQKAAFSAVGSLLASLLHKMAWEDPGLRRVGEYFMAANIAGSGQGRMISWASEIYSAGIRDRIVACKLSYGERWDEWGLVFF